MLKPRKATGMLTWSPTPIHAPLTKACAASSELRRLALKANQALLRFTGDTRQDGDDTAAQDASWILVAALAEPRLRDEVYVQVMKQLTGNRSPASAQRAWNMLALCLLTFPPSPSLDYFVELFVRSRAAEHETPGLLDKLHTSVFTGERPTAPTAADVDRVKDEGADVRGLTWRVADVRREKRRELDAMREAGSGQDLAHLG